MPTELYFILACQAFFLLLPAVALGRALWVSSQAKRKELK